MTKYLKIILVSVLVDVFFALAFRVRVVSDFYVEHIFHFAADIYGRMTGVFPFSVGEVFITLAVLVLLTELILTGLFCFFKKKPKFLLFYKGYSKSLLVVALLVVWLMIMNCSALFRTSRMNVNGNQGKKYGIEQVRILRNFLAEKCNDLSGKVKRDEYGNVKSNGDIQAEAKVALRNLASEFPRLAGFYPNPKAMLGSYMMYQSGYDGVYFPFTMEANYNRYISDSRLPHVICHELAHLKGYIYEDEADYIAYRACVDSKNEQLKYAGYLAVLGYIENDYCALTDGKLEGDIEILDVVWKDACSYTDQMREQLEKKESVISTETVETMGEEFTDTYMDYYESTPNYDEVTKLLLAYYDGILY